MASEMPIHNLSLGEEPSAETSKKGQKKLLAAQLKEKRKEETQARLAQEKSSRDAADFASGNYGVLPLNQSAEKTDKHWTPIHTLGSDMEGKTVLIRARLHNSRGTGKQVFLVFRQSNDTLQGIAAVDEKLISREMVKFASSIPKESIVDVEGVVVKVEQKIESCSLHWHELHVQKIFVVNETKGRLPISIDDASRPEEEPSANDDQTYVRVNLETRLNHRVIDLRTTTNHAIFEIASGINFLFRQFFHMKKFMEIHSPKIISAASEGGANVFKVSYFNGEAYLAQSPQFYKQMAICADFERVFEIAPVFRAENSFTHRHMTEFVGVDLEMTFNEHYHEVLDLIGEMFVFLFDQLKGQYAKEIETVRRQYHFDDLKYLPKTLVLTYAEGIQLLRAAGVQIGDFDDLSTPQEKHLGRLVKEKYHTDFYALDKFPLSVRPFYTMPNLESPNYSNSYDFFIRGEEILSGAQRIHDYDLLCERAKAHGINLATIEGYLDAFKYGAPPHAGGGIGLERVVMLYMGLGNIRKTSLFPRDPKRLSP